MYIHVPSARRRIPFHPHTENQDVRQRHFDFFQIYNRVPEEEVGTRAGKKSLYIGIYIYAYISYPFYLDVSMRLPISFVNLFAFVHTETSPIHALPLQIYDMLKKWDADYVVISDGPCHLRCPEGQTMDYMANTSDAKGRRCAVQECVFA